MLAPSSASRNKRNFVAYRKTHVNHDFKKYPGRTCINLALGHASNNFTCNIKAFKTGPPNPFVVSKTLSTTRKGGYDLNYISPKVLKEQEKRELASGAGTPLGQENLFGKGEKTKLAFLHPVKVCLGFVLEKTYFFIFLQVSSFELKKLRRKKPTEQAKTKKAPKYSDLFYIV